MHVTDPYGPGYSYEGEEILLEGSLSQEQHQSCYDAVGIPAPPYDRDRVDYSIEPASGSDAERLRRYLREQGLRHHSEVMVTYDPDAPSVAAITRLLGLLEQAPVFPGELEDQARTMSLAAAVPAQLSARAAVEALYECADADLTTGYIEAAQRREAHARELIALAEQLGLAEDALDEAVHDSRTGDASQINNEGRDAQIRHLVAVNSAAVARQLIEQAAR